MTTQSYGYIAALVISLFGSALSMVALPWFLMETTGDIAYTSIVLGIRLLPLTLTLFYGVKFIDRFRKKTICVISDLLSGIFIIAIPILYSVSMLNMGILLFIIFTLTAFEQINSASLSSMVPDILKGTSVSSERFNGIIGSLHNFGDLAGPPIAGIIIALLGSSMALALDGMSFLASSLILFIFINSIPVESQKDNRNSNLNELKDSFLFIFRNVKICYVIVPSILVNLLVFPLLTIILPYLAKTNFSSAIGLGFMISSFGAGALLSSLTFSAVGEKLQKSWLLIFCILILMIGFFLLGLVERIEAVTVILFFVGASVGLMGPLDDTILQNYAPAQVRGRVFLVYSSLRFAMIPLAMVIFGFSLDITSIENTFYYMAASLGISLLWLLVNRKTFEGVSRLA